MTAVFFERALDRTASRLGLLGLVGMLCALPRDAAGQTPEKGNPAAAAAAPVPPSSEDARDAEIFGPASAETESPDRAESSRASSGRGPAGESPSREPPPIQDPLKIGGMLYLRTFSTLSKGRELSDARFSAPSLLDVYLDARPSDRVRAFVLGRLSYDATRPEASPATSVEAPSPAGGTSGTDALTSRSMGGGPFGTLDQLWIRFDLARTVFVTAGKQHVRWGTARFWTPTDYLHLRRRNPLDVFDARTGTSMLKLHLPIESRAWNLYAYGITEGPGGTATVSRLAGAARGEFVFGTMELGLGVFARDGTKPRYAADLSFGLGDFDLYGEAAVLDSSEIDRVRFAPFATAPPVEAPPSWQPPADAALVRTARLVDTFYPTYRTEGYRVQAVGGISYSARYGANDTLTLGTEYFYNGLGYPNSDAYLGLLLPHSTTLSNPATPFYLGRHYAALFLSLPSPWSLDLHSFTLSTLGNLSDGSFISRLDYSLVLLTYVRFEAFAALHYGKRTGEFRLGIPRTVLGELEIESPPGLLDLGVAIRVSL